jgi:hypothetical protein
VAVRVESQSGEWAARQSGGCEIMIVGGVSKGRVHTPLYVTE